MKKDKVGDDMADSLTPEKRSWNMAQVKGKDTKPEIKVRKYLFSKGFRYRKNDSRYPGKPDMVLPKYKTVIFVHGCFWHRHPFCPNTRTPKTKVDFWTEKFRRNVEKDKEQIAALEQLGWNVIVIWECELQKGQFEITMRRVINELENNYITGKTNITA